MYLPDGVYGVIKDEVVEGFQVGSRHWREIYSTGTVGVGADGEYQGRYLIIDVDIIGVD